MQLTKLALATAAAAVLFGAMSTTAMAADTVSQNQKQELEVVCEVGAYGQATNCRAKGTQEQSQQVTLDRDRVVYVNGKLMPIHKVVDTALDPKVLVAGSAILLVGITALILKAKAK